LLYTHSTAVSPLLMATRACFSELYDGILSRALVPLLPLAPLLPVSRAASAGLSRRFCRSCPPVPGSLASTPLSITARAAPESWDTPRRADPARLRAEALRSPLAAQSEREEK
jgi:hypothetical protein